jgi:class 3 adenylate cyclase
MRCPSCGTVNREGARFCDNCGTPLVQAGEPAAPAPEVKPAGVGEVPPDAPRLIDGRYDVIGFLGQGGRKRVYLTRDREAGGREFAVAVFATEGMAETALARARREAQAMERLGRHPRIVTVIGAGEHEGAPYLVSEYVPGGDVGNRLADAPRGRFEWRQALEIAADICRALEHAHGHGIVHRDLKPANVWFGEDGRARLGDFGLAATERRSREATELIGTVAYLPPEQALGRAVDGRADLYSLGALLYEMLTGQPPFTGEDAVTVISRHVNTEPVPPRRLDATIPPAVDRLVLSLLAKSPDERPQTAADVRARIDAIFADPDATADDDADRLDELASGAIVGRDRELAEGRAAVDEARAGHGSLLFVAGEPGIGKTRIAEELATYASVRGARVIWGRCHEDERAPAFWPWIEAIRGYVRDADPVGLRWQLGARGPELARLVPEIAELLGGEPEEAGDDEAQERFRLLDAVAGFLADASRSRPLLVVLEDLHWADPSSLELLRFTSRQLADAGLLVIGTYRDVELGQSQAIAEPLTELARAERARLVRVGGLDADAVAAMIKASAGTELRPALVEAIWERTEGNPFFVGEIVRILAASGSLDGEATDLPVAIPEGARDAVLRRLEALSDDARQVLRVAAVAGREFEPAVIERACGWDAGHVAGALTEGLDARTLSERATNTDWLSFSHAIVRETLYAGIDRRERRELHAKVGEAIEAVHTQDLARFYDDVARHFAEAVPEGDPEKAIEYAEKAAEHAMRRLAHEDAALHYGRALELLDACEDVDPERRLRLTLAVGHARTVAGRFAEARAAFDEAAALARETGDADALVTAALGAAHVATVGLVDEPLLALLGESLDALGEDDDGRRVEVLAAITNRVIWRDPQGEAREAASAALELARSIGDDHALAVALTGQQLVLAATPEAPQQRLENSIELVDVAERCGDGDLAVRGYAYRIHSLLELGRVEEAEEAYGEYRRVALELRQPQHLWHLPLFAANRATMRGRFEDAERLAAEALRGGERAQEPLAEQLYALQMTVIRNLQGRLEEALPFLREMARRFPAIPAWRFTLIGMLAELGKVEEAAAGFERLAANDFADVPRDLQWLPTMIRLADAAFWLGDAERAAVLRQQMAPFSGLAVIVGRAASCQGPVDAYRGRLALTIGDAAGAVADFSSAIELATRMADRPFLLQARYGLARALAARGAAGDRERALDELAACLDGAEALGMRRLVESALAARLEVQGLADIDVLTSIEAVVEAVGTERPDLSALATGDGAVTILFSDIENSTLINERLGDQRWLDVLREHNAIFRRRLDEYRGYEVKSQGDGFMLAFGDPASALEFALAVQDDLAGSEFAGAEGISVRMGIHSGEAIAEDGDLFGRSVVLAARIAAQAVGGEILVSEALTEICSGDDVPFAFSSGRELELKGLAGTHRVFRVEAAQAPAAA